jgi:hypothetical protein
MNRKALFAHYHRVKWLKTTITVSFRDSILHKSDEADMPDRMPRFSNPRTARRSFTGDESDQDDVRPQR